MHGAKAMPNTTFFRSNSQRQKGVVAIEFVIIFPVLFTICYAVIAYALAFLVIQNMTYASEEILRKAIGSEYAACTDIEEEKLKYDCEISQTYAEFAADLLLISPSSYYSKDNTFCDADLICTLEIRATPLTAVSIFGFKLLDLSNNTESKLVGRASLLF